jgi:biotin transport system substrate-specific component
VQYVSSVRANTLSSRIVPESWITNIILVAAGSALMALSARFSHQFSFSTVPVTGQTFAVLLIGAVYGSRLGAATMIAYLAEGAAGMPVFSAGAGGIAAIATASGGYLFGFIIAAYVVGFFAERGADRSRWIVLPMLLGTALIYVPGVIWLHQQFDVVGKPITWETALDYGVWPFIAGDLAKVVAASLAVPAGWSAVDWLRNAR